MQRERKGGAFVAVSAGRQGVEDPKKTTAKKKSWPLPIYSFQSLSFKVLTAKIYLITDGLRGRQVLINYINVGDMQLVLL